MLPLAAVAVAPIIIVAGALKRAPLTGFVIVTLTPLELVSVNTQSAGIVAVNAPPLTPTLPPDARFVVAEV